MTQYNHPSQPTNGQIAPKMGGNNPIYRHSSKKTLQWAGVMIDNDPTTTLTAVKPNRHTLAIFMPKIYGATNPIVTTGVKTQRHFYKRALCANTSQRNVASYGGLREPNKIPLVGNKFRRLLAVVDTRHPLLCGKLQTELTGGNNHA